MRRRLGPALLVLALLTACGGDDRPSGSTTTTGAPGAGPTTSASEATTGVAEPGGSGGHGGGSGSGGTSGVPPGPVPTAPAMGRLDPGGVGDLAAALLQPGHGDRIVLEVRAQLGAEPRAATLNGLVGELRQVSGKTVAMDGIDPLAGAAQSWTTGSIVRAADGAAVHAQGGSQVVLRLLFVHGSYDGNDSVLGVAVRGDVAAVFTDQVDEAAGLLSSPAVVEDAVTMHEVGHLLGLVDLAVDTGRDDPEHPGHSTNQDSVMFWAVESDLIGQVLGGGIPTDFDEQDRADLARIRAG